MPKTAKTTAEPAPTTETNAPEPNTAAAPAPAEGVAPNAPNESAKHTTHKPSIGRIVHYSDGSGSGAFAAIIAGINDDDSLNLTVLDRNGASSAVVNVARAEDHGAGWSWPPRA